MSIETKKNEIRYQTSDPRRMLNKYLTRHVCKTWKEDFIDEDTQEAVTIERNEVLFQRGTLIDQDVLAKIRFCYDAGDIKGDIEVSNQKRLGFEILNECLYPYLAQVCIDEKRYKFLFYATSIEPANALLKDYIELNYNFGFRITMIKEFDKCVILTDTLKEKKTDVEPLEIPENAPEDNPDTMEDEEPKDDNRKFYQIETKIMYGEVESSGTFVVNTYNVERAMMLINAYLKKQEDDHEREAKEKGWTFERKEIHPTIEAAKPISIGRFIPKEFSLAYK